MLVLPGMILCPKTAGAIGTINIPRLPSCAVLNVAGARRGSVVTIESRPRLEAQNGPVQGPASGKVVPRHDAILD